MEAFIQKATESTIPIKTYQRKKWWVWGVQEGDRDKKCNADQSITGIKGRR